MHTPSIFSTGLRQVVLAAAALTAVVPAGLALASPMDWVAGERVQGSGNIKKVSRELAHFTGVGLSLPATVELRIGNTESITIETDDNLLPLIDTVIENGVLKVRPAKKNMNLQTRTMKIVIQARTIDSIALGGSGSIESDALRGANMEFVLGGSGSISVKGVDAESVKITVGGSGNFKSGSGVIDRLAVSIGGSGDVDAGQLKAREASVSVAGSGEATVWASDTLSMRVAGSGDVNYYGDPKLSKSVAGSGSAKRLGAAPR
ncbi:MAG: head GIN domain-containing protein [Pseudomonadota bacterium]